MIKKIILGFLNSKFLENNTFFQIRIFQKSIQNITASSFFWIFGEKRNI